MASIQKIAGTVVSPGSWSNFTITALASADNNDATTNSTSYVYGVLRNFDFQIPANSIIDGIEIGVYYGSSAANATAYIRSRISKNGSSSWSTYSDELSQRGSSNGVVYMGSPSDLWGLSLSESEVNDNSNFQVQIDGRISASNRECELDFLEVIIYYTEKAPLTKELNDIVSISEQVDIGYGEIYIVSKSGHYITSTDGKLILKK
jgi:hypothetical protein